MHDTHGLILFPEIRPGYPTSSKSKFNWDEIEKEVEKQERENPDMDGNQAFAQLFKHADADAQRAMMKSMVSVNKYQF